MSSIKKGPIIIPEKNNQLKGVVEIIIQKSYVFKDPMLEARIVNKL